MLTNVLGLLIVLLVLVVIFQIARATEAIGILRGNKATAQEQNNKLHGTLFLLFMVVSLPLSVWSAWYYKDWYLPAPSSVHGAWIDDMFFWTLIATVPVFILTHIALFWFSYTYSGKVGGKAYYFPGSNRLELIWTAIPAFVMVLLVYRGISDWYKIMINPPQDSMIVEATGQQFSWTLRYAGADNKLGTKQIKLINSENAFGQDWKDTNNNDDFAADTLHLQLNKPVLVKINALDVLHSFFLPHFRVKMDAVPGIPTQFYFIPNKTTAQMRKELNNPNFNYELACAELCGQAHFNMRRIVVVEEEKDFKRWFAAQESLYKKQNVAAKETAQPTDAPATTDNAPNSHDQKQSDEKEKISSL